MIRLVLRVSDEWPIITIGPGGLLLILLLIVPHLFIAVPVSVLWVGL
jgi:hypothetical protein